MTKRISQVAAFMLAFVFAGALATLIQFIPTPHSGFFLVHAQTAGPVQGYAWSDGAGWISFDCQHGGPTGNDICATSNYGVSVASDNTTLKGYAWSDTVGWVSFNSGADATPNQLTGCPSGTCSATIVGGALQGWARACAGTIGSACAPTPRTFYLTSGTSWPVPNDWNSSNNNIEVIGGGGGGAIYVSANDSAGGGGGAYASTTNLSLTPGGSVTYQVGGGGAQGVAGGDTFFNRTSGAATICTAGVMSVCAKGGGAATGGITGGAGGASGSSIGGTVYSGGNGSNNSNSYYGGSGGGGAAGRKGRGAAGGDGGGSYGGGGGGGADNGGTGSAGAAAQSNGGNGGLAWNSTAGGTGAAAYTAGNPGSQGSGGGGGGWDGGAGGQGGNGIEWDSSHGSGGGGGGGGGDYTGPGGGGGLYGGGGGGAGYSSGISGSGAQGIIVITTPPSIQSRTDGWDGWISLNTKAGANPGGDNGNAYAPTINANAFTSNYAWGSDVLGWISFTPLVAPTVTSFTASAPTIAPGATFTLSWTTSGSPTNGLVTSYSGATITSTPTLPSGNINTTAPATGGTYAYFMAASSTVGTSPTVQVNVAVSLCTDIAAQPTSPAGPVPPGCQTPGSPPGQCIPSGYTYSGGQCVSNSAAVTSLTALRVRKGNSTTLTWVGSALPPSCTLSSVPTVSGINGVRAVSSNATFGTATFGPIVQQTVVTLTCGATSAHTTVNVVPSFQEI